MGGRGSGAGLNKGGAIGISNAPEIKINFQGSETNVKEARKTVEDYKDSIRKDIKKIRTLQKTNKTYKNSTNYKIKNEIKTNEKIIKSIKSNISLKIERLRNVQKATGEDRIKKAKDLFKSRAYEAEKQGLIRPE